MLISLNSGVPVRDAQELQTDTGHTACITGHRMRGVEPWRGDRSHLGITLYAVKHMLARCIDILAEEGCSCFIDGLASGTDLWAAEHILHLKNEGSDIQLIGVMPFLSHAAKHSSRDTELLRRVELRADMLVTTDSDPLMSYGKRRGDHLSPDVYRVRNYFMVDNSSAVIAFLNEGTMSGTLQTVNYALRRGRRLLRFRITDIWRILDECGTDTGGILSFINELGSEWFTL